MSAVGICTAIVLFLLFLGIIAIFAEYGMCAQRCRRRRSVADDVDDTTETFADVKYKMPYLNARNAHTLGFPTEDDLSRAQHELYRERAPKSPRVDIPRDGTLIPNIAFVGMRGGVCSGGVNGLTEPSGMNPYGKIVGQGGNQMYEMCVRA